MTTRPRLASDVNWVNGLAALALFVVMVWTFMRAGFEAPMGFGEGSIVATLGYAMFDMLELIPSGHGETEGFLVAFLLIAVVLDAALDGALMLARREGEQGVVSAVTDGGWPLGSEAPTDESPEPGASDETDVDGGEN